jgi:hypothetical protein
MDLVSHIWTYHAVHIIGSLGLLAVLEANYSMKKDVDKRKRFGYIRFINNNKGE